MVTFNDREIEVHFIGTDEELSDRLRNFDNHMAEQKRKRKREEDSLADVEDGNRPGTTREKSTELRELRRRNRLLEQENEVLRRAAAYLSQAHLPGKGSTRW